MAQPKYVDYMIHELAFLAEGKEHKRFEIINYAAEALKLTDEQKKETYANGDIVYLGRGGWGLTYLNQAGLISLVKRSTYLITDQGRSYLSKNPKSLTLKDLEQYPAYQDFKKRRKKADEALEQDRKAEEDESTLTPDEQLAAAEKSIRENICSELLKQVRALEPSAFEALVIKLLVALGYGGGNIDRASITGKTGDGGIDGVINEDILGLDTIYVQAKRYKEGNTVGSHDARDFVGALQGKEAKGSRKGIFITASDFTKDALEYFGSLKDAKVIPINGRTLVSLMYEYGVGVVESKTISIKRIDTDFFEV